LRTAQEVAKGMEYIHSKGIVHGDLKPGNVLLKTHKIDRRGYVAKVSDFGEAAADRFSFDSAKIL
jgi:serine/threonine protein kinase